MAIAKTQTILDEIAEFFMSRPTAEEIADFKVSEVGQKRASELLERNRQNLLTSDERAEMEEFMRVDHVMTVLKLKVKLKLAGKA